jgi:hypothetical protein
MDGFVRHACATERAIAPIRVFRKIQKTCEKLETISCPNALLHERDRVKRDAMAQQTNLGNGFRIADGVIPQFPTRSSPGQQAEFALWSGFRLCPTAEGANSEMNADYMKRESTFSIASVIEGMQSWVKETCLQVVDFVRLGTRKSVRFRTIDRLMLSLWLSLPFLLLVSSDWIGMVVLWQALSAAARLRQTLPARIRSNFSNQ